MKRPLSPLLPAGLLAASLLSTLALPALADEAAVRARLTKQLAGLKVDKLTPTPYSGLYEVYSGGSLYYTDEQVSYLVKGALFDTKSGQNLSNERLRQLSAVKFDELPLDQSIAFVKGNGRRQLAVFEDPDCPFCRQLEHELDKLDDVTIHIFLYPLEQLHRGASEKARKIWCAEDRSRAWQDAVLRGVVAANPGTCDTPIDKLADLGRRLRISGTPTMIFADGSRSSGAMPAAQLEQLLAKASPPAAPSAAAPATPTAPATPATPTATAPAAEQPAE